MTPLPGWAWSALRAVALGTEARWGAMLAPRACPR